MQEEITYSSCILPTPAQTLPETSEAEKNLHQHYMRKAGQQEEISGSPPTKERKENRIRESFHHADLQNF
jgi:hypothetical protein